MASTGAIRNVLDRGLAEGNGVLRLEAAWVARDWIAPGRRLGLPESAYDVGERGFICERWLASTTKADNLVGPPDEGLSYVALDGERLLLRDAVESDPVGIMGADYAASHAGLGRLAKIYDFASRIPYHIHPPAAFAARVGRNPKDEAYYFPPDVDMGPHPESFFGVHPWITETGSHDVLLPYLERWTDDQILKHARAMLLVPDEGFHIPSGVLHAPGTALTLELQEDSDVMALFQAVNDGVKISKEMLFKDVSPADRDAYGERYLLNFVDWELNGDPYFYENRHLSPRPVDAIPQAGGTESWIYYNTTKFSGKKLVVHPGGRYTSVERGVYNILVWSGQGRCAGTEVRGGDPRHDELLICHETAVRPHEIENTGLDDLVVIKFFGPDVNPDVPMIAPWRSSGRPLVGKGITPDGK